MLSGNRQRVERWRRDERLARGAISRRELNGEARPAAGPQRRVTELNVIVVGWCAGGDADIGRTPAPVSLIDLRERLRARPQVCAVCVMCSKWIF